MFFTKSHYLFNLLQEEQWSKHQTLIKQQQFIAFKNLCYTKNF